MLSRLSSLSSPRTEAPLWALTRGIGSGSRSSWSGFQSRLSWIAIRAACANEEALFIDKNIPRKSGVFLFIDFQLRKPVETPSAT